MESLINDMRFANRATNIFRNGVLIITVIAVLSAITGLASKLLKLPEDFGYNFIFWMNFFISIFIYIKLNGRASGSCYVTLTFIPISAKNIPKIMFTSFEFTVIASYLLSLLFSFRPSLIYCLSFTANMLIVLITGYIFFPFICSPQQKLPPSLLVNLMMGILGYIIMTILTVSINTSIQNNYIVTIIISNLILAVFAILLRRIMLNKVFSIIRMIK